MDHIRQEYLKRYGRELTLADAEILWIWDRESGVQMEGQEQYDAVYERLDACQTFKLVIGPIRKEYLKRYGHELKMSDAEVWIIRAKYGPAEKEKFFSELK